MFLHLSECNKANFALYNCLLLWSEVGILQKLTPPLMILPKLYEDDGGELLRYGDNLLEDDSSDECLIAKDSDDLP